MTDTYLVTGATGFLGSEIVRQLLTAGESVRIMARSEKKAAPLIALGAAAFYGDIMDIESLRPAFVTKGRLIVLHAAGVVRLAGGKNLLKQMYDCNVNGTKNVIELAEQTPDCRLVTIGSVHACPEAKRGCYRTEETPYDEAAVKGVYDKSKAASCRLTLEAARRGLHACIVLPSGVIGPNDPGETDVTRMLIAYSRGKIPAAIRGGYDFVDMRDVAAGTIAAGRRGGRGESYLLTGGYHSVKELLTAVYEAYPVKKIRHAFPRAAAYAVLPFMHAYARLRRRTPLYNAYYLHTLGGNGLFCSDKARRELDFAPRPFVQSVKDTVAYLQAEGRIAARSDRGRP